jgi:hypothetical protein
MSLLQVDRMLRRCVRNIQDSGENPLTVQGTSPSLMEDSAHSECSVDKFELADGERERKENEQVGLAEATMAEVFQVARGVSQT